MLASNQPPKVLPLLETFRIDADSSSTTSGLLTLLAVCPWWFCTAKPGHA
jgi:hypothetical protein